MNAGY